MRRPSNSVRQTGVLHIRLFEDELQSIKDAAASEGKTVSEYVRARVLVEKTVPYPNVPAESTPYHADTPLPTFIPDVKQPKVEKQRKPWKEVKAPAGKKKLCPHGFAIVSGVTACARCS